MAAGGRLPALVTPLEGDVSDLAAAFQEGTVLAEAYVAEIDTILTAGMHDVGQHGANAWTEEVDHGFDHNRSVIRDHMHDLAGDLEKDGRLLGQKFGRALEDEVLGGGGGGGRGSRRATKMGQSWVSSFTDGLASAGSMIRGALIPILIGAIILASPLIGALIASAVTVGLGLGFAALGTIIAVAMLPKIAKGFAKLADPLRAMFKYAITGSFDNALAGVPKIIAKWLPIFGKQLRGLFDAVAPILRPLTEALMKGLANLIDGITEALNNGMPAIMAFVETIPEVMDAIGKMFVEFTKDPDALVSFIKDGAAFTADLVTGLGKAVGWLSQVYGWINKTAEKHPKWKIVNLGDTLSDWWSGFTAGVAAKWTAFTSWVAGKWTEFIAWLGRIPGAIGKFIAGIPGFFKAMLHQILFDIGFALGKILLFFVNLPANVVRLLKTLGSAIWNQLTTVVHILSSLGQKAVMGFINFFKTLPDKAKKEGVSLKNKLLDFFKSAPSWLYNAGKDIISGLVRGIGDALSWAVDKAKSAAHDIASGFKKALGISSPSRIAYTIGQFFMQGLGNGVVDGLSFVRSGWNRVADAMTSGGYATVTTGMRMLGGGGAGGNAQGGTDKVGVYLDAQAVGYALIPSTQRRAARNAGQTGLGGRTVLGFGGA